jgi:hypothetical protein
MASPKSQYPPTGSGVSATVNGVTFVASDLRSCCSARDMTFGDGLGNTVDLNATGGSLGQFVVGTFQADATGQILSMATNGFGNSHITGYQIRAIPEPSSGMLVLLGLALAAASRGFRSRGIA